MPFGSTSSRRTVASQARRLAASGVSHTRCRWCRGCCPGWGWSPVRVARSTWTCSAVVAPDRVGSSPDRTATATTSASPSARRWSRCGCRRVRWGPGTVPVRRQAGGGLGVEDAVDGVHAVEHRGQAAASGVRSLLRRAGLTRRGRRRGVGAGRRCAGHRHRAGCPDRSTPDTVRPGRRWQRPGGAVDRAQMLIRQMTGGTPALSDPLVCVIAGAPASVGAAARAATGAASRSWRCGRSGPVRRLPRRPSPGRRAAMTGWRRRRAAPGRHRRCRSRPARW